MNKKLMIGLVAGLGVAAIAVAKKGPPAPPPAMWAKMREKMDEMPKDFPPRLIVDHVEATRANTEEILALLRDQGVGRDDAETTT